MKQKSTLNERKQSSKVETEQPFVPEDHTTDRMLGRNGYEAQPGFSAYGCTEGVSIPRGLLADTLQVLRQAQEVLQTGRIYGNLLRVTEELDPILDAAVREAYVKADAELGLTEKLKG